MQLLPHLIMQLLLRSQGHLTITGVIQIKQAHSHTSFPRFQTNLFLWTAFCMWSFHRISTTSMANIPCTENKYHGRMEKGIGTFLSSMCFMSAAAAGSFLKLPGEAQHLHSFSAAPCYHRDLEEHSPGRANCPRCCWRTKSTTCWLHAKKGNSEGNIFNTSLLDRLGIMRYQQII